MFRLLSLWMKSQSTTSLRERYQVLHSCGAFDLVYKVVLFRHALCMQILCAIVFQRVFFFFFFFGGGGGGLWKISPKVEQGMMGIGGGGIKKCLLKM